MALQEVGVKLVADGASTYVKAMEAVGDSTEKAGEKTKKSAKDFDLFAEANKNIVEGLKNFAVNLPMAAFGKFTEFMGDSISAAGNFEQAMNRFSSVTGTSGAELEKFDALFMKLGADTEYSSQQAADAAVNLAKGGLSPATIAGGALADTLTLATAGELDLAQAAEITAKQLGVWSSAGVTSADVANLMAQAANASTVDVDDLAMGLANAGGVAKNAGLSFQETVQTMALIAPGFSSAADAGTSFKTFLQNLIPSSDSATAAFKALGLMTLDGKNKFYDASGAFVGMQQAAQLLSAGLAGLTEQQKNEYLATAFGSDAIRAAAKLAESGASGYMAMGDSMVKAGSAADQAKAKQTGYNFAMETMKGSIETLQISLGQKLLPVVTDLVKGLTEVFNSLIKVTNAVADFVTQGDKMDKMHNKVLQGATNWEDYNKKVDMVNEQIPFYMSNMDRMNRQQFEFNQSLIASGMSMDEANKKTQEASQYSAALDGIIMQLTTIAPEMAAAYDQVSNQMITLGTAGQGWQSSMLAINEEFKKTGDIDTFTSSVTNLYAQFQNAKSVTGVEGGGYSATLQQLGLDANATSGSMAGLSDAAMRYANIAPVVAQNTAVAGDAAQITQEKYDELRKVIEKVALEGQKALDSLLNSQVTYQSDSSTAMADHDAKMTALYEQYNAAETTKDQEKITKLIEQEQQGYATQQSNRDIAYANERMAQQAQLGELLIKHITAWGQMNQVSQEKIDSMVNAIAQKYGVAQDSTTLMFGTMTKTMEQWAQSGSGSAEDIVNSLLHTQNTAAETQSRITSLTKQMVADLVAQKEAGKLTIAEYNAELAKIPAKVTTVIEVQTRYDEGMSDAATQHGAPPPEQRAYGGPVQAGNPYMVGENRQPELFIPYTNGYVAPPAQAGQIAASYATNYSTTYNYSPTYGNMPRDPSYDFKMMELRARI